MFGLCGSEFRLGLDFGSAEDVLFAAELETLEVEIEALLLEFELRLRLLLIERGLIGALESGERAVELAFGRGAVAVERFQFFELDLGRGVYHVEFSVESAFAEIVGALTAPEIPAGEHGVGDKSGVFGGRWLVRFERFGEKRVEVLRLFVGEEEHLRGTAVLESIEAGQRRAGEVV